mgnify:CR=1 FL=1
MTDQITKWKEEFEKLEVALNEIKYDEDIAKAGLKDCLASLRKAKKEVYQTTKKRKILQKKVRTFWPKKKGLIYRHRKWAQDNPGKAFERLGIE